jgi:UDP-N-acetylglucosamine--N-acetylmuramyl-(pentapeptide) pyrophosphoryl-undecaprenol N-acetylglucosamine transferase
MGFGGRPNILILAGGGGHTGFAYSLAQKLEKKANLVFLVPYGDTISYNRLSRFGEVSYLIKPRGPKTSMCSFAVNMLRTFTSSLKKVKGKFDFVVSTGSNFCIPPALISLLKGFRLVNIEAEIRFTKPSQTARVLQPFSTITALQWHEQKTILKGTLVGPLLPEPEVQPWNGGYILITGGSFGHKLLFDTVNSSEIANVVLHTGAVDPKPYIRRHPEWKIMQSSPMFPELLAGAEVVVSHFGYTALEAFAYKKPTVVVFNQEWKRNAGRIDAEIFAKKLGANFVSEINLENLVDNIEKTKKNRIPNYVNGAKVLANMILNFENSEHV